MIARIIEASVRNRVFILVITAMLTLAGLWAVKTTPVDAIPDLSDVQVIVYTPYPGQAPSVVEDQVTYPLSTAMLAVPYAKVVRGYSFFGFSLVYVIFEDGTDLYWARSRVLEYLNFVSDRLPQGVTPQLGPDATGVGWVYMYALSDFTPRAEVLRKKLDRDQSGTVEDSELPEPADTVSAAALASDGGEPARRIRVYSEAQLRDLFKNPNPPPPATPDSWLSDSLKYVVECFDRDGDDRISKQELSHAANFRGYDLAELRTIQDWYLRYDLMSLPGVSEVASVGGFVRQYQVEVDPDKLRAFGISIDKVRKAIQNSNLDVGGRLVEMAELEFMVRGRGYLTSTADLNEVPIAVDPSTHTPVLLKQVANVQLGPEVRRGLTDENGRGDVVTGVVIMRFGGNALEVDREVKARLAELAKTLPEGVEIHTAYDRSSLIERAIETLNHKLIEEMIVVSIVTILFLLHLRSSLVAILTLPVGVLVAFVIMRLLNINSNIMSLGGIALAIGVMVDAAVVMVENMHKHREREPQADQIELAIRTAREVGPALFFSLAIVTISFLPVFTLQAQEGRMFKPLAYTKTFALGAASILSITLIPALMVYMVRGRILPEHRNPLSRLAIGAYRPLIARVLRHPWMTLTTALVVLAATVYPYKKLGSEFMPPLNEGDLLYMPTTPPGISITKAKELLEQTDRIIAQHPQVAHVLGKVGRAETATDPAPLTMIETVISLKPKETWPKGKTIEDIAHELDKMIQFPGLTNAWTMPIKTRIDMLATGIKTPVGIKLLGDDLEELSKIGERIEAVVRELPGTASVYSERVTGGNYINIDVDRAAAARYGLNVNDVQDVVRSAIGGMNVTWTIEGLERYPVNLRYPRELRDSVERLKKVEVPTPMGHYVTLGQVAHIYTIKGPPSIKSENARRSAWIYVDLTTDDIGGYVAKAKKAVEAAVRLPPGVSVLWSGQYEYMQRAKQRMKIVVPFTIGIIFLLLYTHFRSIAETLIVIATLPFALVGGVWLMFLSDYNLSVAVAVGFIALAGLAAETGVVMLVYVDEAWERYIAQGRMRSIDDLRSAIMEGAVERVRPILMTGACLLFGLLPIMWGSGTGTRVMKRIAAPMVGGLVSSILLTLIIIPAAYLLWKGPQVKKMAR